MKRMITRTEQSGFTIVELMVATLVFSVILVIITGSIIHITQMYYKGVTLTNTQNASRTIIDSVSQAIQFNGGGVSPALPVSGNPATSGQTCVGDAAYNFRLGYQVPGDTANPNDLQDPYALTLAPSVPNCSQGAFNDNPAGSTSLLGQHMRLTKFNVQALNPSDGDDLWNVQVTVVYGDYDLLCDSSLPAASRGGCSSNDLPLPSDLASFLASPGLRCRSGSGSAYCAVSALSTVVQQRLTPKS